MSLPRGPLPDIPPTTGQFAEVRARARRRLSRRTAAACLATALACALAIAALRSGSSVLEADDALVASPDPSVTANATPTSEPTASPSPVATTSATASTTVTPTRPAVAGPTDAEVVALTPGCGGRSCVVVSRADVTAGTVAAVSVARDAVPAEVRYVLVRDGSLVDALPESGREWLSEYLGEDSVRADPDASRNVLVLVNGGATAWWVHAFRPTSTSLGLLSGSVTDPDLYGDGGTQLLDDGGFQVGAHGLSDRQEVRTIRYGWDGRAYVRTGCQHQPGTGGKDEVPC